MRSRNKVLVLVVVAVLMGTAIGALRVTNKKTTKENDRVQGNSRWPTTDYVVSLPSDPEKAHIRKKRNKKFNKSEFRVHPNDPSENTVIVDAVDPKLPALPVAESTEIFIGTVLSSQAFIAEDQTGVYSEFTVNVSRVLKTADPNLSAGSVVELQRPGGRVKFRGGRIHWYSIDKENMPESGCQYVFFVARDAEHNTLKIITAYEMKNGKIQPLDEMPQFRRHAGKDEAGFLNALQTAITDARSS
jgi:hypothetical protein